MSKIEPRQIIAIHQNTPRGEMTAAVAIDYGCAIDSDSVSKECYSIANREITSVSVKDELNGEKGNFVYLELMPDTMKGLTRKMIGFGPDTSTKYTGPKISVKQHGRIKTVEGLEVSGWLIGKKHTKSINETVDQFEAKSFSAANGKTLNYHLFAPAQTDKSTHLPLVVFMHDSSVCSKDVIAPLIQGRGGIVWAEPEEQMARPAYVLVPQYSKKTAFDDFTVSEECGMTVELIRYLLEDDTLCIDANRIYGTGQSMGGMMLFEMNSAHPDLFAGCYYVACQWDPVKVSQMKKQNMWILISEKDEKAFSINEQGMKLMEASGGKIARGHLNAKAEPEEKERFAKEVLDQGANIQFTYYEGESVLPPGMKPFPGCFHLCTWSYAYDIEPIRRWLFEQRKK